MSRYLLAFLVSSLLFLSTHAGLHPSVAAHEPTARAEPSAQTPTDTTAHSTSTSPSHSSVPLPPSPLYTHSPSAVPASSLSASRPSPFPSRSADASSSSNSTSSPHHFHTTQYDSNVFYLERLCAAAPWSVRIKPGLLFQYRAITYKQHFSGIEVSTGAPWLALFEGSLTYEEPIGSGNFYNENDVWASADGGRTWDLVSGISRNGVSRYTPSALPNSSFYARGGSNNCEDPASDYIFSIGGTSRLGGVDLGTNQVWYSSDGKTWKQQDPALSFTPTRYSASCDLDASGHIYTMGGINKDQNNPTAGQLVNDVWSSSIVGPLRAWRRVTASAGWPRRAEHLVVIGESHVLQKEIIYVMGGLTELSADMTSRATNDIYASSDGGVTWVPIVTNSLWGPRWGHSGFITAAGVLVVFGGSNSDTGLWSDQYTYDDVWTSFDGGSNWSQCRLPDGGGDERSFVRHKAGVALTEDEEMVIASGIFYPRGAGPDGTIEYTDVWKTPFKLSDTADLATRCNAFVPRVGIGLRNWPRNVKPADTVFAMTAHTRRAPWSARASPALLVMQRAITYRQVTGNVLVSTPPNWLLMYEGSLAVGTDEQTATSENDVWASGDEGQTWNIISGISYNGSRGYQPSTHPDTSFRHRRLSNNCEDPSNDDVFSIGGLYGSGFAGMSTNEVWYSSDSLTWSLRSGSYDSFIPTRYASSCDIDGNHNMFVVGGRQYDTGAALLNDVWMGTNLGRNWVRQTDRAPFKARTDHLTIIHDNRAFGRSLIYVIGGMISADEGDIMLANDVWVTSDQGVTWALVTAAAPFPQRRGLTGVITNSGVMLVIGGTYTTGRLNDQQSLRDMWLSLDGGYTWTQCNLPSDHGFVRGQQGATLTPDERLMLASGYAWEIGAPRTDYADLWVSNISIANAGKMAQVCGELGVPSAGVGLRTWPGTVVPVANPTLSVLAISAIATLSIVVVSILLFCYWSYKRTGRLPVPSFLQSSGGGGGGSTQPRRQPVGNGDYFQPSGGGGHVGGGGGFGSTSTSGRGRSSSGAMSGGSVKGVADVFSSFESGGDGDYHPPSGGYVPPGANGRDDHSHSLLS